MVFPSFSYKDMIYEASDLEYAFGLQILGVVALEDKKRDQVPLEDEKFFFDSKSFYQKATPTNVSLSQVVNSHFRTV